MEILQGKYLLPRLLAMQNTGGARGDVAQDRFSTFVGDEIPALLTGESKTIFGLGFSQ